MVPLRVEKKVKSLKIGTTIIRRGEGGVNGELVGCWSGRLRGMGKNIDIFAQKELILWHGSV
jgi:hypothetical protein